MAKGAPKFLFDPQDRDLLGIVNGVLRRPQARRQFKGLFQPYLHPNGIKEMAASKDLRVAYAVIHLLDSLAAGRAEDRLGALRAVRDEVLHCSQSHFRINTGRVLVQIMKELVRTPPGRGQLELAHDFRMASSGNPLVVRRLLRRHHLLEMPEEWNQVSFDDHVHDANTKGRKFPTHLIMDAWIKGIRSLTVIHYNHVSPEAVSELMEAADVMGIKVRIGVEFACRWGERMVNLIWSPRGFVGAHDFAAFLDQAQVRQFMARGREVSEYQEQRVLEALDTFNQKGRLKIKEDLGVEMPPLDPEVFRLFVGMGQASKLHLTQFVHQRLLEVMQSRVGRMREEWASATPQARLALEARVAEMDRLVPETLAEKYIIEPDGEPLVVLRPHDPQLPELARGNPCELLAMLAELRSGSRVTLNLTGLAVEDVLELVNQCQGGITHLEIFNLKDFSKGNSPDLSRICQMQEALNSGNPIVLGQFIRRVMAEAADTEEGEDCRERLTPVLENIGELSQYYARSPLGSRLGSDSTGRSSFSPAMGLAVVDTLPPREQRRLRRHQDPARPRLPIRTVVDLKVTYSDPERRGPCQRGMHRVLERIPGLRMVGCVKSRDWVRVRDKCLGKGEGNLVPLGGGLRGESNGLCLGPPPPPPKPGAWSWHYLNTGAKNGLKVFTGFIPAAITFGLHPDWWVLAWLGAPIWFGITGLRNVLQSVLGGGGLRRSPLMGWRNYVSWGRLADSLFFTGFSVPLLDYLVKSLLLDQGLGINTHTSPIWLYTIMSLVNGLYLASHNLFRGLPRAAVVGNLFRSVLAIPLAMAYNWALGGMLDAHGLAQTEQMLQRWAAVISKAASDTVAGFIEGLADRKHNLRMRAWDYQGKLAQVFRTYAKLEVIFPRGDGRLLLSRPKDLLHHNDPAVRQLGELMIINALDLMYFWMYQPRAHYAFQALLAGMSPEERDIVRASQQVLTRQKEVSQMFLEDLVGKRFSKALSFYLDRWYQYMFRCDQLVARQEGKTRQALPQPAPLWTNPDRGD